jgi:hypothetical protein
MEVPIGPLNLSIAVPLDQRLANAAASLERGLPRFADMAETALGKLAAAALVSGGPSLSEQLPVIRQFAKIVACGSVHDYLIEKGIIPTHCVIFDPSEDHARFYRKPQAKTLYLVASTCSPPVFEALKGFQIRVWHPYDDVPQDIYGDEPRIGGGSSVTLRTVAVCHIMGYREMHMFGFDCSFDDKEHAYPYHQDRPKPITVNLNGREFLTTPALLQQAQEFLRMYSDHQNEMACVLYGQGLVASMWQSAARVLLPRYT